MFLQQQIHKKKRRHNGMTRLTGHPPSRDRKKCITKNARRSNAKPLLQSLHWLPVRQRVTYKLATVCYQARSTSTPAYIQSLLVPHVPSRPLPSSHVPRTRTVFAIRALSLHRPFATHCQKMSSSRTPKQLSKSD